LLTICPRSTSSKARNRLLAIITGIVVLIGILSISVAGLRMTEWTALAVVAALLFGRRLPTFGRWLGRLNVSRP
jgi:hypothetical protein